MTLTRGWKSYAGIAAGLILALAIHQEWITPETAEQLAVIIGGWTLFAFRHAMGGVGTPRSREP